MRMVISKAKTSKTCSEEIGHNRIDNIPEEAM